MEAYKDALWKISHRYYSMARDLMDNNDYWGWSVEEHAPSREDVQSLIDFCMEFQRGVRDGLPMMKLNRWFGYIQGTLIAWKLTTVQHERDFTRPWFRPLDFPEE